MTGLFPAPVAGRTVETVQRYRIECPGWSFAPVFVARSFVRRLSGAARIPSGAAIVVPGRSVHGMWGSPRIVVALDRAMAVIGVRALGRGRVVTFPSADRLLELPVGAPVPPLGARLVMIEADPGELPASPYAG